MHANALETLMQSARKQAQLDEFPQVVEVKNKRDEMRNHIATWFKDNQWSFSRARRESFGTYDCLWFLNHQ